MKDFLPELKNNALFEGIADEDVRRLFECLRPKSAAYKKGAFIVRVKSPVKSVYILLSGSAHIIEDDFWGNQTIVETLHAPVLFGEAYVLSGAKEHLVNIVATQDSEVLQIDPVRFFKACPNACAFHGRLIQNINTILATKVVLLTKKLLHIGQRSIRRKLISYFSMCAAQEKSSLFTIPYSRQQLADYLCVERTALSHELARMRNEGLISYEKKQFHLLNAASSHE